MSNQAQGQGEIVMTPKAVPQEPPLTATRETPGVAESPVPAQPQSALQDLLPEINRLASKLGGLDRLAAIIATLQKSKE